MFRYVKNSVHEVGTASVEFMRFFCHITTNQNAYLPCLYKQKSRQCNRLNGFYIQMHVYVIFLKNTSRHFYFACFQSSLKLVKKANIPGFWLNRVNVLTNRDYIRSFDTSLSLFTIYSTLLLPTFYNNSSRVLLGRKCHDYSE